MTLLRCLRGVIVYSTAISFGEILDITCAQYNSSSNEISIVRGIFMIIIVKSIEKSIHIAY